LSQDQTPFPQDFDVDQGVDDEGDKTDAGEFSYQSNGLEIDKKKLFAVQHRGKCFAILYVRGFFKS
jgi:hypothetical protein